MQIQTIGAFEAKTHFSELIEDVSHGRNVTITRRGKPVAKLIPYQEGNVSSRSSAISDLIELSKQIDGKFYLKALVKEGRKY